MSEEETFVLEESTNNNNNNDHDPNIKINNISEEILIDYDSDSDDGFSVIKKKNSNCNAIQEQIECINDILETILSIPRFNISFIDYIKSHNNLITDLLKTHITTTNNIHLLSLLYFCIDLLIKNKSEIGLFCFNRITNLCITYDTGFNINNENNELNMHYSINKKSLRLLTKMVN
eukprot:409272_1